MTRTEARTSQGHGTRTLPPLALSPEEAAAVVAALAVQPPGPYAAAGPGVLRRVIELLEPDEERRTALLAHSVWVSAQAAESAAIRVAVERGVVERRVVVLRYRDGKGRPSRREVEPQLIARTGEHWFLVAWCREREAPRWFRIDRIAAAELTGERAPRRDPALFGAPSDTHPAGRALGREPSPEDRRRGLRVLPGGQW